MSNYRYVNTMMVKKYFTKEVMDKLNNSQKWAIISLMKTNKKWSVAQTKLFNDILGEYLDS